MKPHYENICALCSGVIEGRPVRCVGGVAHRDCLDRLGEPEGLLEFASAFPGVLLEFLDEHRSDDFLDDFWTAFREEHLADAERWATS